VASASQEEALAKPDVTVPDLWIPDSSLWVQRLRSDVDGTDAPARSLWLYPPVATSPLVLAASPDRAPTLTTPARTWAATLGQAAGVAMTNPASDTAGLLTLLTVQNELQSEAGTPTRALVSTLVRASQTAAVAPAAGFLALRDHPTTAAAFPSSEQSVVAAEQATSGLKVTSIYPTGKALQLDFPLVQFSRPGGMWMRSRVSARAAGCCCPSSPQWRSPRSSRARRTTCSGRPPPRTARRTRSDAVRRVSRSTSSPHLRSPQPSATWPRTGPTAIPT
jgi:hypothetical protein